ncbi:MAG: hypothetical protein LC733_09755 [Actinobacteria bacterium]|nr:hypothetical protein [Actinomycetota bacterium]
MPSPPGLLRRFRWLPVLAVAGALAACGPGRSAPASPPPASPSSTGVVSPATAPPPTRPTVDSIDDCSPIPQGIGAPAAGPVDFIGPVVIFFEASVGDVKQARVSEGVRAGQRLVEETLGGFRFDEPICVDVRATTTSSSTVGVVYGANHIVLYAGARPVMEGPPWLLSHVAAHEFMHFWQQDVGAPREAVGPVWLLEGSAELLGYRALIAAGLATENETREFSLRRVAPDTPSLQTMERRSSDDDEFSYPLSFLAAELLIAGTGVGSFRDYWRSLSRSTPWETAFTESFGVTPGEFYARFQEHRSRGFPR